MQCLYIGLVLSGHTTRTCLKTIWCVLKVWSYTENWHLPSASAPKKAAVVVSGITYHLHIYFVSSINGYSVWWYTLSTFSIFGRHFLCTDDDFSWCLSLLADCEGRSWRDKLFYPSRFISTKVQITHDSLVIIKFPHTFSHTYFILSLD